MTCRISEQAFAFCGIISGTARCVNTKRPLTHLLDCTERGLAVNATQSCATPNCPDPFVTDWRPVGGYEGVYDISSHGDIRRVDRGRGIQHGRVLKDKVVKGYRAIQLWHHNCPKSYLVHVLVARAFIGPPPEPHYEVNHKDGVKVNACYGNLEWLTRPQNMEHAWRTGLRTATNPARGERVGGAKLTEAEVREIRRLYKPRVYGTPRLAREFGVHQTTIYSIVSGENWKCVK